MFVPLPEDGGDDDEKENADFDDGNGSDADDDGVVGHRMYGMEQ